MTILAVSTSLLPTLETLKRDGVLQVCPVSSHRRMRHAPTLARPSVESKISFSDCAWSKTSMHLAWRAPPSGGFEDVDCGLGDGPFGGAICSK